MEISRQDYNNTLRHYWTLVNSLPIQLQEMCPNFDFYISPSNWRLRDLIYGRPTNHDWVVLSTTGTQRYQQLQSPHARAILAAYAARKLP